MGRPIKKKFFGNLITPFQNHATGGKTGAGGEGVASVTVTNSGTNYSQGVTVSFAAPDIAGGIRATGTPVIPATGGNAGTIASITITNSGSGYQSAPVMTVTKAATVTAAATGNSGVTATNTFTVASVTGIVIGMTIAGAATGSSGKVTNIDTVLNRITTSVVNNDNWTNASNLTFTDAGASFAKTVVLTSGRQDAIKFNSYLTTGTTAVTGGDILKQEASRRYLVQNSEGKGQCKLVTTSTLTAGTMNIVATDWNGSTYYVRKLTAHRAVVVQTTASTAFLVADGHQTGWTLGAATGTVVTIAHTV